MAARTISGAIHAASLASMTYGYVSLTKIATDEWARQQRGGRWQFLTVPALAMAWLTMAVALRFDIAPERTLLHSVKRALAMISLPVSCVVSLVYWMLIFMAPKLIVMPMPGTGEPSSTSDMPFANPIPFTTDVSIHLVPAVSLIIDFFMDYKYDWSLALRGGSQLAACTSFVYALWVEWCAAGNGYYPYPFLNTSVAGRVGVYSGATIVALLSFWFLNLLNPRKQPEEKVVRRRKGDMDEESVFGESYFVWFNRIHL